MGMYKKSPKFRVYLNGNRNDNFKLLHCEQSAGGKRLDHAVFEVPWKLLYEQSEHFDKLSLNDWKDNEIEVVMVPEKGADTVIHWGKLVQSNINYGGDGDPLIVQSRTEPYHFGSPFAATPTTAPHTAAGWMYTSDPLVFNPIIDNISVGNAVTSPVSRTKLFTTADNCIDRVNPLTVNGGPNDFWTLAQAVHYVCEWLNPETYILNHNTPHVVLGIKPYLLRNVEIPFGLYLPDILDQLLTPFGFSWRVHYGNRGQRFIRFFALGRGRFRQVKLQSPGAEADVDKSHIEAADLKTDLAQALINRVTVQGDYNVVESTFELLPGWDAANDATGTILDDFDTLSSDHPDWKTKLYLRDVWRKWVLNEAGDYSRHRLYNFAPMLGSGNYTPRRRPLQPCIAFDKTENLPVGGRHGMILEWYDTTAAEWKPAADLGAHCTWSPLDREAGIYFSGEFPPELLMHQAITATGVDATQSRLRITASVRADVRIQIAQTNPQSLLADERGIVIDGPNRWQYRFIHGDSINVAKIRRGELLSTAVDDRPNMLAFANEILAQWSGASVDGTLTLFGADITDYLVGDTLTGTDGRSVSFLLTAPADPNKLYPTVMAVRYDALRQATTLTIASQPLGGDTLTP